MQVKLATDPRDIKRLGQFIEGYFDEYQGMSEVRFCTPKYLRDTLRMLFDKREQKRYIHPHHKPDPTKGGMIYEGCFADSWSSGDNGETLTCTQMELGYRHFPVSEIVGVSW